MTDRRCSRQRQHSASANSESSYSGSADESSYSGSSDESSEESTRIILDPPMSWYPPGSLPSASSSIGSTHDTTAASGRSTVNLERSLDHDGDPLAIITADAVVASGSLLFLAKYV
ncbi:Trihelix transcription factor GT-1 [Camellia lanceoleosa]|uniref:Trihelix transcription factor GT-1 n=1 Tax=Camellia lanceoleosa TaxID=1840588 RepID=A0ACC0IV71_9ERIC|nr:Trihelix transcription factor GT-1 [Camellia lanceoleosa]